jgi:hypothetical protein
MADPAPVPEPRDDEERHPLESEDALREPRDIEDEGEADRAPLPGSTSVPSGHDRAA